MSSSEELFEALYEYRAAREGDLTFQQGDILIVIGDRTGPWWLARNKRTGLQGYIPHNYLEKKRNAAEGQQAKRRMSKNVRPFVASCDYVDRRNDCLSFKKGERLEVLKEIDSVWCEGRHMGTAKTGLIPVSYLRNFEIRKEEWYFGSCGREDAERWLLSEANRDGTFLVRDSFQESHSFSLSVLNRKMVKHFRIIEEEDKCFISREVIKDSIKLLINHYCTTDGLCTKLGKPCVKTLVTEKEVDGTCWEIPRESLVMQTSLGEGKFGCVQKALWNGRTEVAVKSMKSDCMEVKEFKLEAKALKELRHPRLVRLYGVCTQPQDEPLLIVTELVQKGSLEKHLQQQKKCGKCLDTKQLIRMGGQVAAGMAYLEKMNVIHRDLAARNVLVEDNNNIKIADFGLARFITEDYYRLRQDVLLPLKWMAPEVLFNNIYTSKSDVWSFGILLYEIITHGGTPYPGVPSGVIYARVEAKKLMDRPPECPEQLYDIMVMCWQFDSEMRPIFKDLRKSLELLRDLL